MTLKSPFLANEPANLRRSRALQRFTVASPLVAMLAVGMVGHVGRLRYARPASAPGFERRILAYVPRVAGVQALQRDDDLLPARKAVESEADRWLAGYRSGELQPLKPAFFEDHFQGGPRGEVARAAFSLSDMLVLHAMRDLETGNAGRAVDTALRAARVGGGVREFETQSLLQSLLNQRRTLVVVARAWPSLPEAVKLKVKPEIESFRVDPRLADRLRAEEKARYADYRVRQRIEEPGKSEDGADWQGSNALERSIRVSNERIDALLKK